MNFAKFIRTPFFIEHVCWLLLSSGKLYQQLEPEYLNWSWEVYLRFTWYVQRKFRRIFTGAYLQFSSSYDKFLQAPKKFSTFSCKTEYLKMSFLCSINLILTSEVLALKMFCIASFCSLTFISLSKKEKQLVLHKFVEE